MDEVDAHWAAPSHRLRGAAGPHRAEVGLHGDLSCLLGPCAEQTSLAGLRVGAVRPL